MSTIDRVLVILKEKNFTQKDLTDYLGISRNAFTDWKSGRIKSWQKYLPQIAAFLGVSVDELLGNTVAYKPQMDELQSLILTLDAEDRLTLLRMAQVLAASDKYKKAPETLDA